MKTHCLAFTMTALVALVPVARASEPIDWEAVGKIRDEGLSRSQVWDVAEHLVDRIGARLTGSPGMREANEWTMNQLREWGLENARMEPWGEFGRGWTFSRTSVHLVEPRETPLQALPVAWTPGTDGPQRGAAMIVELEDDDDFEEHSGKLAGKILLLGKPGEWKRSEEPVFHRHDHDDLARLYDYPVRSGDRDFDFRAMFLKRLAKTKKLNEYLEAEGVVATLAPSSRQDGILRVGGGGSRRPGESVGVPSLIVSTEQYNWLHRRLSDEQELEIEVNVEARFHDEDLLGYNTLADLPGTDLADEIVMIGAHLDSWHASAGANDNAAGVAVVMEAVRILKAAGLTPRRTVRVALWSGEEQGLLGARGYVDEHFATRPAPEDPEELARPRSLWPETWPIEYKPDYDKFSAYYNLDNGSGKIRGIYTQSNAAVVPIFERWLEPFHDLGAETVTNRNTGGTDHQAFDRYSLPGFQFIQDQLDYSTRTHHTNLDTLDHTIEADLKQAAVIMASFVYHTAMRDERLPRKAKPQQP